MIWWSEYIADWNGISLLQSRGVLVSTTTLTSDVSGSWGYATGVSLNIAVKELIPIVIAAEMRGKQWCGLVVNCRCDNM